MASVGRDAAKPSDNGHGKISDGRRGCDLSQDIAECLSVLRNVERVTRHKTERTKMTRIVRLKHHKSRTSPFDLRITRFPHGLVRLSRLNLMPGECTV